MAHALRVCWRMRIEYDGACAYSTMANAHIVPWRMLIQYHQVKEELKNCQGMEIMGKFILPNDIFRYKESLRTSKLLCSCSGFAKVKNGQRQYDGVEILSKFILPN